MKALAGLLFAPGFILPEAFFPAKVVDPPSSSSSFRGIRERISWVPSSLSTGFDKQI